MTASDVDHLESVLAKTEAVIAGVSPDQSHLPTPCPEFDTDRLVDHLVGWAASFSAKLTGETFAGDPNDYRAGPDPATEFHDSAAKIVGAYRKGGDAVDGLPIGLLLMEYVTHGWDLATATGQPVTYTATEAELALATGHQMLRPEYRGPGKTFGYEAEVSKTADSVDKLVAFLGRSPDWQATT